MVYIWVYVRALSLGLLVCDVFRISCGAYARRGHARPQEAFQAGTRCPSDGGKLAANVKMPKFYANWRIRFLLILPIQARFLLLSAPLVQYSNLQI